MDKIFGNVCNKVKIFSTGIKEDKFKKSAYLLAREGYEKMMRRKNDEEIEKIIQQKEKMEQEKAVIENITNAKLIESSIYRRMNDLYKEAKDALFKDVIFEMFTKSLYLDHDFILEKSTNIKTFSDSYIDSKGGFQLLENAIKRTDSTLLKSIKTICEESAKKICDRKVRESKEACDDKHMVFDMTEEERDEFDYKKGELNIDELTDLVKKNVLTVVQDEKEKQTKEKELYDQIENELKEDENIKTEKDVKEALDKMIIKRSLVEETTLFNALMRNAYKDLLESVVLKITDTLRRKNERNNTKINVREDEVDELNEIDNDVNIDIEELNKAHMLENDDLEENEIDELLNGDDFDRDDDDDYDDTDDECDDDDEFCDATVDMDLVLAEALTKYTMMELTHMIKLESFTVTDIRKMIHDLLK